ncbi:ATP-binding protein, partial [candidate division KSB1 bacterium]|nr:ATP-binding protein [candidate division KSB1 bacterium]
DLTTHAVCVGMTGSGKTGLGIGLIEEAAIDNIPVLVIDPKGDMTNLLLTFPDLNPESFRPWVNESEASQKGLSPEDFAIKQAELWKNGMEKWGQSGERIKRLREAVDFCIYTPGSTAGIQLSILKSLSAPPPEILDDADAFSERISTVATSLLGLLKIDADPIKSREHILISNILSHFWMKGKELDLSQLIQSIQSPPFSKIGVFNLDSFYPDKERFELAIALNNLLAAPAFQSWLEGEPMDIQQLLYSKNGKPRVPIFYIAHLSDAERMFFVTLFLNQVLGWMRTQPGTSSLRAMLYIDEIFGYMPPIGNPPSKKPLLTLLKQARAFGLGLVLATQNPVDLDYKGLSNTGTWFIGRLQTDRDRERVLDGLASAAGGGKFDKPLMEKIISGLGKRIFLLHNVHETHPEIFETRWVMSYLAGPMTRNQIKELMAPQKVNKPSGPSPVKKAMTAGNTATSSIQPNLAPEISPLFVPIRSKSPNEAKLVYQPYIWGSASIQFVDNSRSIDFSRTIKLITPITNDPVPVDWEKNQPIDLEESELLKTAQENPVYADVPDAAQKVKNFQNWAKDFEEHLFRSEKVTLYKSPSLKVVSKAQETERDFRARISQSARENRDEWVDKLRTKYEKRIASLQEKIRKAEDKLALEQAQSRQKKIESAISIGTSILGAFMGRKIARGSSLSRAGRNIHSTIKESGDVSRAEDTLAVLQQQLAEIEEEFQREVDAQSAKFDAFSENLEKLTINLKRTSIFTKLVNFIWVPFWQVSGKPDSPAW